MSVTPGAARSLDGNEAAQRFHQALIKLPAHLFRLPTYRKKHYPVGSEGRSQLGSLSRKTTIGRLLSQSNSQTRLRILSTRRTERH